MSQKTLPPIKIVFSDLDLTLLYNVRSKNSTEMPGPLKWWLAKETLGLLNQLIDNGVILVVMTGRRPINVLPFIFEVLPASYLAAEHGALIYNNAEEADDDWSLVHSDTVAPDRRGKLWDFEKLLREKGVQTDVRDRLATFRVIDQSEMAYKKGLVTNNLPMALKIIATSQFLDVIPATAGKEQAIKYLLQKLKLSDSQAAMIGDGLGDLPALKIVSHPCTMRHAHPEVIAYVKQAGGVLSTGDQHYGIQEILKDILSKSH